MKRLCYAIQLCYILDVIAYGCLLVYAVRCLDADRRANRAHERPVERAREADRRGEAGGDAALPPLDAVQRLVPPLEWKEQARQSDGSTRHHRTPIAADA